MQPVFGARQLVLQIDEVLVGFQIGVVFHHHQQSVERRGQLGVGGILLGQGFGTRQLGARIRNRGVHLLFMLGVTFYGIDQIGDQIRPALQLGLDRRLLILHALLHGHQTVVAADTPDNHQRHHSDDRDQHDPSGFLFHIKRPPLYP